MSDIHNGMVLAAGLGTRMRPLTDNLPKPLLTLKGRSLLDHALDRMASAGFRKVVVNAHWHAEKIAEAVSKRNTPKIILQREQTLLETGGGIVRALPNFNDLPFAVVNGDAFWIDGETPALARLAAHFDQGAMDGLLLLVPTESVISETGRGDFFLEPDGRIRRPNDGENAPYVYAGLQVLSPSLFSGMNQGPSRLMPAWLRAISHRRLFGLVHAGSWFHLSTPPDLIETEQELSRRGLEMATTIKGCGS